MPTFSANLGFLFTEVPFLERFAAARACGFRAVEFMFPYGWDTGELAIRIADEGLILDLFNLPAGDFEAGERGMATDPARRAEFHDGVERALERADALGVRKLNCLVGRRDESMAWQVQYDCLVDNLRWAAGRVGSTGRVLLVEQLNPLENPGFFLDRIGVAERVLDEVGSPHLRLQFDVYHVQRTQGDVVATLRRLIERVGHVQIADSPERHEPGTGELNYATILAELDRLGYAGRIGLEYRPSSSAAGSLGWVAANGWRLDG
jgi:hydroxypyruvate isomerase